MVLRSGKFAYNLDANLTPRLKDLFANCQSSLKGIWIDQKDPDPQHGIEAIVETFLQYTSVKIKFLSHCGNSALFYRKLPKLSLYILYSELPISHYGGLVNKR
jgi:hypothetical protein